MKRIAVRKAGAAIPALPLWEVSSWANYLVSLSLCFLNCCMTGIIPTSYFFIRTPENINILGLLHRSERNPNSHWFNKKKEFIVSYYCPLQLLQEQPGSDIQKRCLDTTFLILTGLSALHWRNSWVGCFLTDKDSSQHLQAQTLLS